MTKFNPKRDLPYLAAIAQAAQFALAGSILLGLRGWLFGGLLGALVSVTMAYASSQYAEISDKRKPYAMAGMIFLGVTSPIVISTSVYPEFGIVTNDILRVVACIAWGVIPDISVFLTGFTAGKGLVKQDDKPPQLAPQPRNKPKQGRRKTTSKAEFIAILRNNPGKNDEQLAQLLGVKRQAVQQRRVKLTPAELGFNVTKG